MANESDTKRAAAICEQCGAATAVRVDSDGKIRPIGSGTGECCTCENADLRIMNDDSDILEDVEPAN